MSKKEFQVYDPPVLYKGMKIINDIDVPMRDGKCISININLPDAEGKFPALLAISLHNKDMQEAGYCESLPPSPSWSKFWFGPAEAGDSRFLTSRGYAHVVAQARGGGKSDSGNPYDNITDMYDLIEWMAVQEWCDGNIGMFGLSCFSEFQFLAASTQPPHLKAIFPLDPAWCYSPFREINPGGVLSTVFLHIGVSSIAHMNRAKPPELPDDIDALWQKAMENPDYRMYGSLYNFLSQKGTNPTLGFLWSFLLHPYEVEEDLKKALEKAGKIKIPVYTGAGQYGIDYHIHWTGSQNYWNELEDIPKKLMLTGPAHQPRPYHAGDAHSEAMKWYDYWLKGIDTGIMDEPAVRYYVTGENKWRYADNWPIPETVWTPYYLDSWERLRETPIDSFSWEGTAEPDAFVQSPPNITNNIAKLRYMTAPLADDTLIAGPISMNFFASLDSDDTNWIVTVKDLGPDYSDRTGRHGEREIPDIQEKYLTKGFLRASLRELDEERSTPWKPFYKLTKESEKKIVPGEINEYKMEIMSVCHMFKAGHRICVEITCLDLPDGACCAVDTEYIPYHVCRNATVCHKIYRDGKHPSHILLPVIPL
jgi:hypothetical protein